MSFEAGSAPGANDAQAQTELRERVGISIMAQDAPTLLDIIVAAERIRLFQLVGRL